MPSRSGSTPPTTLRAAAERHHRHAGLGARRQHRGHLLGRAGQDHGVGGARAVAGADPHQVGVALARRACATRASRSSRTCSAPTAATRRSRSRRRAARRPAGAPRSSATGGLRRVRVGARAPRAAASPAAAGSGTACPSSPQPHQRISRVPRPALPAPPGPPPPACRGAPHLEAGRSRAPAPQARWLSVSRTVVPPPVRLELDLGTGLGQDPLERATPRPPAATTAGAAVLGLDEAVVGAHGSCPSASQHRRPGLAAGLLDALHARPPGRQALGSLTTRQTSLGRRRQRAFARGRTTHSSS